MRDFAIAAILLAIPVGLIARQPDLGTALLVFASGFFVIFLAGLSWKVLGSVAVAGAVSLPLLWPMLHDYQRKRVLMLLDPRIQRQRYGRIFLDSLPPYRITQSIEDLEAFFTETL